MGMFSKIKNKVDKFTPGGSSGIPGVPPGMPGGGSPSFDKNRVQQRLDYLKKNKPNDPAIQHLQNAIQTGSEKHLQYAKDATKNAHQFHQDMAQKGYNQLQNGYDRIQQNAPDFRNPTGMGEEYSPGRNVPGGWGSMGGMGGMGGRPQVDPGRLPQNEWGSQPLEGVNDRMWNYPAGRLPQGGWGNQQGGGVNDLMWRNPPGVSSYNPNGMAQQVANGMGYPGQSLHGVPGIPGRIPGQNPSGWGDYRGWPSPQAPIQGVPGRIPGVATGGPSQPIQGHPGRIPSRPQPRPMGPRPATPPGPTNVFKGQASGPSRPPQKRVVGLLSRPPGAE